MDSKNKIVDTDILFKYRSNLVGEDLLKRILPHEEILCGGEKMLLYWDGFGLINKGDIVQSALHVPLYYGGLKAYLLNFSLDGKLVKVKSGFKKKNFFKIRTLEGEFFNEYDSFVKASEENVIKEVEKVKYSSMIIPQGVKYRCNLETDRSRLAEIIGRTHNKEIKELKFEKFSPTCVESLDLLAKKVTYISGADMGIVLFEDEGNFNLKPLEEMIVAWEKKA